jgi:lipoate-protein ligase A
VILLYRLDPAADGPTNMAADELLAEGLPSGGIAMRFYGWSEPTLSLGAFQRFDERCEVPGLATLPVVRRPSGGGAILHGTDLTYAIAVCRSHPWGETAQRLYDAVHGAAVELLRGLTLSPRLVEGGEPSPVAGREPYLCFDRRSPGDVVVEGDKVLGSAQRRHRAAVVQHGSLLLRRAAHDAGIEDFLGRGVDLPSLCRDWVAGVASAAGADPRPDTRPAGEAAGEAWRATVGRYREDGWTRRR